MTRAEVAVAWFFGAAPDRARRIQVRHTRDRCGTCAGCNTQTTATPWPCLLRQLADEAVAAAIPDPREEGHPP